MQFYQLILITLFFTFNQISVAKTVKYNFDIDYLTVNHTGKAINALSIDHQIPGPTIEATVGDTLEVTFNNKLAEDTSIHWHGVLLPNSQDGVPYLTTPPIKAHSSFTYRYKIKHAGTYWYHSHTGLQEQRGVYGSLVFHPQNSERFKTDQDNVVVLSDWTNESPKTVLENLKKDGDYYALKKHSVQSWDKVIQYGSKAIRNRLQGALNRMGPMDISDIGYDAFLANGKQIQTIPAKAGDTIRVRLINAAASSYFNVEFAGGDMTIIAADGVDVEPLTVKRLKIAIAETYDIIIKIPSNQQYELRATSEDGTGFSSSFFGNGSRVFAPDIPKPNLFLTDHNMHMMHNSGGHHTPQPSESNNISHSQHQNNHSSTSAMSQNTSHLNHVQPQPMKMPTLEYMNDYNQLKSTFDTSLPKNQLLKEITLRLTGNMERYVWAFDNKTLGESEAILIKKGENVRVTLINDTMMHHPIHLHGHFFRVLNGQGEKSPLKHTVNVPPMETVVIEFDANEEKNWFFHCHNLYHMMSGMARVFSYYPTLEQTKPTIDLISYDPWYAMGEYSMLSNMMLGMTRFSNTRSAFEFEFERNYHGDAEVEFLFESNITRFLDIYIGLKIERENESNHATGLLGIHYVLPLLIEADVRLNSKGKFRLEVGSDLQLTEVNKLMWYVNTDSEYRFILSFDFHKNISITSMYDSENKWGIGFTARL